MNTGSECVIALPPQPTAAKIKPDDERLLLAKPLHDRPDQHDLDDDAEKAERREQVAGMRRVEAEAPRPEQREGRLVDRERSPVEEVDREEAPQAGAAAQLAERLPRRARDGVDAVDGLRQPEPREQRRHHR